jgi:hypothetical protein
MHAIYLQLSLPTQVARIWIGIWHKILDLHEVQSVKPETEKGTKKKTDKSLGKSN